MSGFKIQGNASGAGNFTLTPPNGATDRTLTLPDRTGNLSMDGPTFSANRVAGAATLTSATWSLIAVDNELWDTDSVFDSVTTWAFQPTIAGYYQFNFGVYITQSTSASVVAGLAKNGTMISQANTIIGTGNISTGSFVVHLNGSTEYVQLYAYGGGTSPAIQPGYYTFLQGFFLRP